MKLNTIYRIKDFIPLKIYIKKGVIRISINRYCKVNNISQILFFFHKFNTGFPCQVWAVFILKTLPAISIAILKLLFLTGHLVLLCFWSFLILQRKSNPAFSIHISNLTIHQPKLCISLQIYNSMGKIYVNPN